MSITAYTGFRCGTRDQGTAARRIERLTSRLIAVGQRREIEFIARRATEIVDQRTLAIAPEDAPTGLNNSPWAQALAELRTRQEKLQSTHYRDSPVDVGVTITLWKTRTNGEWLGLVGQDGSNDAYHQVVTQRDLSAYGYWNLTDDRPPRINARQWKKRANAWSGTLARQGEQVPSMTWTIAPIAPPDPHQVLHHLPALDDRVNPLAEGRLFAAWSAEQPALPANASAQKHLNRYMAFREQVRQSPALQAGFAAEKTWVTSHLIQDPVTLHRVLLTQPAA